MSVCVSSHLVSIHDHVFCVCFGCQCHFKTKRHAAYWFVPLRRAILFHSIAHLRYGVKIALRHREHERLVTSCGSCTRTMCGFSAVWLTSWCSLVSTSSTRTLAMASMSHQLAYSLVPKLHFFHEVLYKVKYQCKTLQARWCLNPIVESCL